MAVNERFAFEVSCHQKKLEMRLRTLRHGVVFALVYKFEVLGREDRADFAFDSLFSGHRPYYREFAMEWKDVDWSCLKGLRDRFLGTGTGDYWRSIKELEHYDLAFAPRIRAKWDAVWRELGPRLPDRLELLDWGCGTGIASRAFAEAFPKKLTRVRLWDRSSLSCQFAAARLQEAGVPVEILARAPTMADGWLCVSHVANELDPTVRKTLRELATQAAGFVWVEPGTPESARALEELRETIRSTHTLLGPCPHAGVCGMNDSRNARHWCHHFAEAPAEFFTAAEWNRFGREMQIDLRSLPVGFLAASRTAAPMDNRARVIGRPRVYKGYARALICEASGVSEKTVKPEAGAKLKDLRETVFDRRLSLQTE